MEADTANMPRSRILREMNANRLNPFNSPPSSTGSHGSVSPTMSTVFSELDDSTRMLNRDIARVTAPRKLPVNFDAARRKWPGHFAEVASRSMSTHENRLAKEDRQRAHFNSADDTTGNLAWTGTKKTRAEMQPRVDNDSSNLSIAPPPPTRSASEHVSSRAVSNFDSAKDGSRKHGHESLRLQRQQNASHNSRHGRHTEARDSVSPNTSSGKSSLTAVARSPNSLDSPKVNTPLPHSSAMPEVSYLEDFVTGTLRFHSMENKIPIFVKHGRVHDRQENPSADAYPLIDGIPVPEDEKKIFVSMDMIRNEIVSLQEHYDSVNQYAQNLQQQVERLEIQLKARNKVSNSGQYSHQHESALRNNELQVQVTELQAQLEQCQRKASNTEKENVSLARERDRAANRLQTACEDINKLTRMLSAKEKEVESSHKELENTDQIRQDNDTLQRDLVTLKHGRDKLELEINRLCEENEALRHEVSELSQEVQTLRGDNQSLRRGDDSLTSEVRSLRSKQKKLTEENEDLRETLDAAQHELDAAREEVDELRQQAKDVRKEKTTLLQDNEGLVRHNEKYFKENKLIRRENSAIERSLHELKADNGKLKDEVEFLKQQLDHFRPLDSQDVTGRQDDETQDENIKPGFFAPDIAMQSNNMDAEVSESVEVSAPQEYTGRDYATHTTTRHDDVTDQQDARRTSRRTSRHDEVQRRSSRHSKAASKSEGPQKVKFWIPERGSDKHAANKKSKRRSAGDERVLDSFQDLDDNTTGLQSLDDETQDHAIALDVSAREQRHEEIQQEEIRQEEEEEQRRHQEHLQQQEERRRSHKHAANKKVESRTQTANVRGDKNSCPALSSDARRVLDNLCQHNCRNCTVCSRITSHGGVVSRADVAAGKKRVSVPRPVPVSDLEVVHEDQTVRPAQSPGFALALAIKTAQDKARHLQLEVTQMQARYHSLDASIGRRERNEVYDRINQLLKRLNTKNDEIYNLYDVLEGQKAAGQAMTDQEVEMTILNITGMTVRDLTVASEQQRGRQAA